MFGITRAPEIDRPGLTWFNVEEPLSLAALKGRLVILDFWTLCCINCLHVVPTLRRIEDMFPTEVTVIGVHSPKFPHERDPAALAHALARLGITHPVVHDPGMTLWQEYGIRAWPTLVFLSPDGRVVGQLSGEPHPDLLAQGVGDMIDHFFAQGQLVPKPHTTPPPLTAVATAGALRYPGKIKPCPGEDGIKMWAIADSGHNQVVVVDDHGTEIARYGQGAPGWRDGGEDAMFDGPEGLICHGPFIYVADTRNHAIRRIHRPSGQVETLAGLGVRGGILQGPEHGTPLASPWDLELSGQHLYFANAGSHQIGMLNLETGDISAIAGTGGENIHDDLGERALLAQPSGLALSPCGKSLYFADSETSALRRLRLDQRHVDTLIGAGLFEFGLINGDFSDARLQHPLGVACGGEHVFVADSYNSTIRVIEPETETIRNLESLFCNDPQCRPLCEPAGIVADGPYRLLVSDTNNHRIVEFRLKDGTFSTWYE